MEITDSYDSTLGKILMKSDGEYLTGLWFEDSSDDLKHKSQKTKSLLEKETAKDESVFKQTKEWLDIYFSGNEPTFFPKYKIENATRFRLQVLEIVKQIPFGKVVSYNHIAKIIAEKNGKKRCRHRRLVVQWAGIQYV